MTADRILGPMGVLPPDPFAVGARVMFKGLNLDGGVVFAVGQRLRVVGLSRHAPHDTRNETVVSGACCLDLTEGCLGPGTRALWHLLDLGEQQLTAPGWVRGAGDWWAIGGFDVVTLTAREVEEGDVEGGVNFGFCYVVCTAAAREPDPRRALAMVLAAVAEARR